MTLTELQYIVAVADERHFGRAAERCFVSQPTLSVAVRKLEQELGVTLFERNRNEVFLTALGERILAQARRVLYEANTLKDIAKYGQEPLRGPLRVGAIYTIGPYLFPELIPVVHQKYPNMPLVVEENFTAVLARRLKRGEVDAVILSLPFDEVGIQTAALYDEPFVALLPAAHPLAIKDVIEFNELSRENVLLLGQGHCFRDQVLALCPECLKNSARDLHSSFENSSLETIRHMVAGGLGVTILPCTAAGADRYRQRLLSIKRFTNASPVRQVALAWRRNFSRPQAIDALRHAIGECLLSCVNKLPVLALPST